MPAADVARQSAERQRRMRRSALMWALIAAAFYFGSVVLILVRGSK